MIGGKKGESVLMELLQILHIFCNTMSTCNSVKVPKKVKVQ